MQKNILILCALMFNALNAMNQEINLPISDQKKFLIVQQKAALTTKNIWKDQTKICTCTGKVLWSFEYNFDSAGAEFKIPLCNCDEYSNGQEINALLDTHTLSLHVKKLSEDQMCKYEGKLEKIAIELNYFNTRFCHSSRNNPSLREKNNGQELAWHNEDFSTKGSAVFAPENQDFALFCSNKQCISLENHPNLPQKFLLILLAEPKSKFFEKLEQQDGSILYSAWSSQASLMAYIININSSNTYQSNITCLGEIKSYKHLPDNSYLYVRSCKDEFGNIKVVCGDKQASFLDVFNINIESLSANLRKKFRKKIESRTVPFADTLIFCKE